MKALLLKQIGKSDPMPVYENPASFFSSLPVLKTLNLLLRPMKMSDAPDIFRYASDPEVSRYVLWEPHKKISETRSYIRYVRRLYRHGLPSSWAVVERDSLTAIGSIGFMWYSPVNHSAEVGYSFSRQFWNRGYATQALRAVIDASFRSIPDLNRIEAQHDTRNPASGRVMEKCGMKPEGILRSRLFVKSDYIDIALYAILRTDLDTPHLF